ncbi:uncharacterized protein LOC111097788 isoform X1 [Canis lupus familiaris]|uniref:uncharacterized protein LOC111097788 isoform X1 n=1 Tax=Canis lupus familiaris TaxID=9615 RepID=UPI0018F2B762|nr:uncharacterized protein LOC111097788 isoform X1 [Canis lupus familiaris]XP_038536706.1 uncharacterized protein LOC111097788 isoform X1 [Canis lupus familiaris]XP_038536707.1 uncharacterized protein LOC111097788 isoform X1 [Canis lupus familiaris]
MHLFAPSLGFEIQQHLATPHLSSVCTCLHPVSASKSSSTSLLHTSRLSSVCTYLHPESWLRNPAAPRYSTPLQCMHLLAPSLGFEIQQHLAASCLSSVCTCLHPESQLRNPAAPRYSTPLQCMHLLAPSLGFEIQQHLAASHLTPLQCMYLFALRVSASKSSSTSLVHTSPVIKAKAVHFTGEENCKYKDSLKPKKGMNK